MKSITIIMPIVILFSGYVSLNAQLSHEKFIFLRDFMRYVETMSDSFPGHLPQPEKVIRMPILNKYPQAVEYFDSSIAGLRESQKSLDRILDTPGMFSFEGLADSLCREIIFYLYCDQLKKLEKQFKIRYWGVNRNAYIFDGAGTSERGFVRLECLTAVGDALEDGGPLVVWWSQASATTMDSVRACRIYQEAAREGVLMDVSSHSQWGEPLSAVKCASPFDEWPAFRIKANVEYDDYYEPGKIWHWTDTYCVFVLQKNSYEYLVAFSIEGGCFDVETVADFIDLNP